MNKELLKLSGDILLDKEVMRNSFEYQESAVKYVAEQILNNLVKMPGFAFILSNCDGPLGQLEGCLQRGECPLIGISFFSQRNDIGNQLSLTPHIKIIQSDDPAKRPVMNVQSQPLRLYRLSDEDLKEESGLTREQIAVNVFTDIDPEAIRALFLAQVLRMQKNEESNVLHYLETDQSMPLSNPQYAEDRRKCQMRNMKEMKEHLEHYIERFRQTGCLRHPILEKNSSLVEKNINDEHSLNILLDEWAIELAECKRIKELTEAYKIIDELEKLAIAICENQIQITIDSKQPTIMIDRIPSLKSVTIPCAFFSWLRSKITQLRIPFISE